MALLADIDDGAYAVAELTSVDYRRVAELCDRYADADIGFVDAAVPLIVERLDEPKLATLDRRHFSSCGPDIGPRPSCCRPPSRVRLRLLSPSG
ncbi:MAG: hypothetical protein R3C32_06810 [Chloroflexota bacterium]